MSDEVRASSPRWELQKVFGEKITEQEKSSDVIVSEVIVEI